MFKYGVNVKVEVLPGEKHGGPLKEISRIFSWLLTHKREIHPLSYKFVAETPLHGRAWWTSVERFEEPGKMAYVQAEAAGRNTVHLRLRNVAEVDFIPDPAVFDLQKAITVTVNGVAVATEMFPAGHDMRLRNGSTQWRSEVRESRFIPLTAYRQRPVATAPESLDMLGTEKRLANWITDAMRSTTRAEIALYSAVYYRGLPIMNYSFDLSKPNGQRIVKSSLDPERTYLVAMEAQAVEYPTFRLGGLFRNLEYVSTATPLTTALYGHAATNLGVVKGTVEGRVLDVSRSSSK